MEAKRQELKVTGLFWLINLIYLTSFVVTEIIISFLDVIVGFILYCMLLIILILSATLIEKKTYHKFFVSLTLVPLARIFSVYILTFDLQLAYKHLVIGGILLIAVWVTLRVLGISWQVVGVTLRNAAIQIPIALTSVVLSYLLYQVFQPIPMAQSLAAEGIWFLATVLLFSTGFIEELVFRGVIQWAAIAAIGRWWGGCYVAILYAVLQIGRQEISIIAFTFAVSMYFTWVVIKTRSILGVALAHGILNIMIFIILPSICH